MLLRRCVWNETHELPRILGYTKEDGVPEIRGFTDGVCEDCVEKLKAQAHTFIGTQGVDKEAKGGV